MAYYEEDEFGDDLVVDNNYDEDEDEEEENGEKKGRTSSLDEIVHSEEERVMVDIKGHPVCAADQFQHHPVARHYMPANTILTMDSTSMPP